MTDRGRRRGWKLACLAAGLLACAGLEGCGKERGQAEKPGTDGASAKITSAKDGSSGNVARSTAGAAVMQQAFAEATISDPPGPEWGRPPDTTMAGKSVGKLYTEVVRLWDDIHFADANGRRIEYSAVLDTDMGAVTITLLPELAPNHVRNFVALAKAGYYDGLVFERAVRDTLPDQPEVKVEYLEAGCPIGTGDAGYGSIGYWLKSEIKEESIHDEGVVGAFHGPEEDIAACKFYINLCKAPFMDGRYTVFGKVTQGLDITRKILTLPVRNDPEFPEGDRPVNPVVIRKVTIVEK